MKITLQHTTKPRPIKTLVSPGLLAFIGTLAVSSIKRRVRAMVDLAGRPFAPLSADYAEKKAGSGRNAVPDLTLTGALIGSIQAQQDSSTSVRVGVRGMRPGIQFAMKRAEKNRRKRARTAMKRARTKRQ